MAYTPPNIRPLNLGNLGRQPNLQTAAVANGMSSPMGVKADSPDANVSKPGNTMSSPTVPSSQDPMANNPYPGLVSSLANFNPNNDPGVISALQRQRDFESQYANDQSNIGTQANPFGYATSLNDLSAARHAMLSPVYQSQVTQAYTGAGQRLGALGSATSAAAPRQQGYALLNPFNNQPVGGGGTGNSLSSLAPLVYAGGRLDASSAAGGASIGIDSAINNAHGSWQQFSNLLSKDPGFNSGQFVWGNTLNQLLSGTFSSPTTPGIQAAFNNTISQYAQVFPGGQAEVQNLIRGANPQSMQALLQVLDSAAKTIKSTNQSVGQGGGGNIQAPANVNTQQNNDPLGIR